MYLEGIYKGGATSRSEKDVKFKCDLELSCDFGSDAFLTIFFFFFFDKNVELNANDEHSEL